LSGKAEDAADAFFYVEIRDCGNESAARRNFEVNARWADVPSTPTEEGHASGGTVAESGARRSGNV
jgi:hypothetical protein